MSVRPAFIPTFVACACALVAALALPAAAGAAPRQLLANLETGDFSQFMQTNEETGSLDITDTRAYDGRYSARATYRGGPENGFQRGIYNVSWPSGVNLWYGAAFYLPDGFYEDMKGYIDLLRWDNYPSYGDDGDTSGIGIYGSDEKARLLHGTYHGDQDELVRPFKLPEGRWVWLEVHQRLSESNPLNEVYLDGKRIDVSHRRNTLGRSVQRIRYGLVAVSPSKQTSPLTLYFDRAAARISAPTGQVRRRCRAGARRSTAASAVQAGCKRRARS